jgi:hypothetical protein
MGIEMLRSDLSTLYFVLDSSIQKLIRYFGSESHIIIPRHVQILCSSCFLYCKSFSSISFETDSELACIESYAFCDSFVKSITIPGHVQILYSSCFRYCPSFSSISSETDSQLTRVESHSFSSCFFLTSITIPRHVQILCLACFSSCTSLSSISFETDSELTRIKAKIFQVTHLSLVVSFITGDAFPAHCTVMLANGDSNAVFGEWAWRRQFRSSESFERRI